MNFHADNLPDGYDNRFADFIEDLDNFDFERKYKRPDDPRGMTAMNVLSNAKSSLASCNDLPLFKTTEFWKSSWKDLKQIVYKYDGFTDKQFRARIWMWFLGLSSAEFNTDSFPLEVQNMYKQAEEYSNFDGENHLIKTIYKSQIQKDVDRSFTNIDDSILVESLRGSLLKLLFVFFHLNPDFHYYQGFHEVASQVVLVYHGDLNKCYKFLKVFSLMYLRDFMTKTVHPTLSVIKIVLFIIYKEDPEYYRILRSVPPYFPLSCIITVFAHDIKNTEKINHIWEYLLFTGNVTWGSLYLYAATLLLMKQNILKALYKKNNGIEEEEEEEEEKECHSPTASCFEDISLSSSSSSISNSSINDAKQFFNSTPMSSSLFSTSNTIVPNDFHGKKLECSDIQVVDSDVLTLKLGTIMEDFLKTDLSELPGINKILPDKEKYEGITSNLNVLFGYTHGLRAKSTLIKKLQRDKELIISSESSENNLVIDILPHSCLIIKNQTNMRSSFHERLEVWEKEIQDNPQKKLLIEENIMDPQLKFQRTVIDRINRHARHEKFALMGKKTMVAISFIIGILSIVLGYYWNSPLLEVNKDLQYLGLDLKFMSQNSSSLRITVGDLVYQFGRKFSAGLSTPQLI